MLILTRRHREAVMIGDNVTVVVLGIKGGQVRLGIQAPTYVQVHREEIYLRIKGGVPIVRPEESGAETPTPESVK